jgi:hypothetical protein
VLPSLLEAAFFQVFFSLFFFGSVYLLRALRGPPLMFVYLYLYIYITY